MDLKQQILHLYRVDEMSLAGGKPLPGTCAPPRKVTCTPKVGRLIMYYLICFFMLSIAIRSCLIHYSYRFKEALSESVKYSDLAFSR